MNEWLIAYRGYSDAELEEELTWLRAQVRNPFSGQTEGDRSYTKSTAEMRDRLAAATQVKGERSPARAPRAASADFSGIQPR